MKYIIANFGNDSVALIQWAFENKIKNVSVLSVDTGWRAKSWEKRVQKSKVWLQNTGIKHFDLVPDKSFKELVIIRNSFPSKRFNWCISFLKGMTLLNWLNKYDKRFLSEIWIPHRKSTSRLHLSSNNSEQIIHSPSFDNRKIRYPIFDCNQEQTIQLISKTPFKKVIKHRSLECHPCIYLGKEDSKKLTIEDIKKTKDLENIVKKNMFSKSITQYTSMNLGNNYYDEFLGACSKDYGCGL